MAKEKLTQSEIDGVQYRRAKLWQIILIAFNAFNGMAMYFLIGLASYSASIGYGIATLVVGGLLTFTRIFDAITDPLLAFLYDRVNTPFGKVRPLMVLGWLIQSAGVLLLFNVMSSKGHGIPVFLACYMLYVIGYTIVNMTAQTLPALLTNDPKQRPTVGVWQTALNSHGFEHRCLYQAHARLRRQLQSGVPECRHLGLHRPFFCRRGSGLHRHLRL